MELAQPPPWGQGAGRELRPSLYSSFPWPRLPGLLHLAAAPEDAAGLDLIRAGRACHLSAFLGSRAVQPMSAGCLTTPPAREPGLWAAETRGLFRAVTAAAGGPQRQGPASSGRGIPTQVPLPFGGGWGVGGAERETSTNHVKPRQLLVQSEDAEPKSVQAIAPFLANCVMLSCTSRP